MLATNTSTLDIDAIAAATSRPDVVIGLHFFSPANVMRLLEIVRGAHTSPHDLATALAFAKTLGKVGVVVGNGPGFVGNRMMFPYMYEAQFLVEEGATPEQVDRALTDFGMAMGIFAVDDMAGLDVAWRVRQELGHFSEPGERQPLVRRRAVRDGPARARRPARAGTATATTASRSPDPEVARAHREAGRRGRAFAQRTITDEEIVERTIYALINEGARVLDDGVALRAVRHRRHLRQRLRLPRLPRRPDVLRRPRRTADD